MRDNSPAIVDSRLVSEPQAGPAPSAAPGAATEVVPLPEALRQIGRDARRDAESYLDETTVRFGGE